MENQAALQTRLIPLSQADHYTALQAITKDEM